MKAHRGKPPTDGLRHVNGRGAIVGRERADNEHRKNTNKALLNDVGECFEVLPFTKLSV
jgi:hypothetical protein